MTLKGKALIELTNTKTGQVERYEDSNMLTDAISKILKPIGYLKGQGAISGISSFAESFMGGIILFDGNISETSAPLYAPSNVSAVGYAAYNHTNATTDTAIGSWNSTETKLDTESRTLKLVYDFATSQANGVIKCLCLTHPDAARNAMYGSDTNTQSNGVRSSIYAYPNSSGAIMSPNVNWKGDSFDMSKEHPVCIDSDNDLVYYFTMTSTSSIRLIARRGNITSIPAVVNHTTDKQLVSQTDVTLPGTTATVGAWNYDLDDGYLYLCGQTAQVSASGAINIMKVDIRNASAEKITLLNKTGASLSNSLFVHQGLVYAKDNNNGLYVYTISLHDENNWQLLQGTLKTSGMSPVFARNGRVFYNQYTNPNYGSDSSYLSIANGELGKIETPTASALMSGAGTYHYVPYLDGLHLASKERSCVFLNSYLATINNLTQPIEKTDEKTMKITYTIQEM